MDLSRICANLRNYFIQVGQDVYTGTYTVNNHDITPSSPLIDGQYFRVVGSVLNDGVYLYGNAESMAKLKDETFDGAIWAMRVPQSFLDLVDDYDRLNAKVEELALVSAGFASESFDGYSYTLSSGAPAELLQWKSRLDAELNQYRRISAI